MSPGHDATSRALEHVGARLLVKPRRATTLVALARPAGELAGLLALEVLLHPRARTSVSRLARSLVQWIADRRPGGPATAQLTARRVRVAQAEESSGGVLVRRVETAIVVFSSEQGPVE
jgi:hypothetical protein